MAEELFFIDAHAGAPELEAKPGDIIHLVLLKSGEDVPAEVVKIDGLRIYFKAVPAIH